MLRERVDELNRALDQLRAAEGAKARAKAEARVDRAKRAITEYLLFAETSALDTALVSEAIAAVHAADAALKPPDIARATSPEPLTSARSVAAKPTTKLELVPPIIHCTWAGGGAIEKTKSLRGIQSWLAQTNCQIWIWWDDGHMFNMHTRQQIRPKVPTDQRRVLYDQTAAEPLSGPAPIRVNALPGRDIHNLRFLAHNMSKDEKLALAVGLIRDSQVEMHPLRSLAKEHPKRVKLCNLRSHEMLTGFDWLNETSYDLELTARGMFAAAASDILRYEVLYNFGGVYLDVDIELTGPLELRAPPDGALAGITSDKSGEPYAGAAWKGRTELLTPRHAADQCLYLSNCCMAACPKSPLMDAVRRTIRLSYDLLDKKNAKLLSEIDRSAALHTYWSKNITRSTLDLTGPNLLRDILWLKYSGRAWSEMPRLCTQRLVDALEALPALRENTSKASEAAAFSRVNYVWRDDEPVHQKFWAWLALEGAFDMRSLDWQTDAADKSDCRVAGMQMLKGQADASDGVGPEDVPALDYFPKVGRGQRVKGTPDDLMKTYKQLRPPPNDLEVEDRIEWGFVHWRVTAITPKLELERL